MGPLQNIKTNEQIPGWFRDELTSHTVLQPFLEEKKGTRDVQSGLLGVCEIHNQLQNHIHKNSSIHSYFRQLRHILELKNKKMKKITPKKSSLFSILFFLELLSENPEEPNHQDP